MADPARRVPRLSLPTQLPRLPSDPSPTRLSSHLTPSVQQQGGADRHPPQQGHHSTRPTARGLTERQQLMAQGGGLPTRLPMPAAAYGSQQHPPASARGPRTQPSGNCSFDRGHIPSPLATPRCSYRDALATPRGSSQHTAPAATRVRPVPPELLAAAKHRTPLGSEAAPALRNGTAAPQQQAQHQQQQRAPREGLAAAAAGGARSAAATQQHSSALQGVRAAEERAREEVAQLQGGLGTTGIELAARVAAVHRLDEQREALAGQLAATQQLVSQAQQAADAQKVEVQRLELACQALGASLQQYRLQQPVAALQQASARSALLELMETAARMLRAPQLVTAVQQELAAASAPSACQRDAGAPWSEVATQAGPCNSSTPGPAALRVPTLPLARLTGTASGGSSMVLEAAAAEAERSSSRSSGSSDSEGSDSSSASDDDCAFSCLADGESEQGGVTAGIPAQDQHCAASSSRPTPHTTVPPLRVPPAPAGAPAAAALPSWKGARPPGPGRRDLPRLTISVPGSKTADVAYGGGVSPLLGTAPPRSPLSPLALQALQRIQSKITAAENILSVAILDQNVQL